MSQTDTVPRVSRCSCGTLVLSAWSGDTSVTLDVATFTSSAAALAYASGHRVYRVRSTRRPTLASITDPEHIVDNRDYVLAHTCASADLRVLESA
jgi:hypothetical protein